MARGDPSLGQAFYLRQDLCRGWNLPLPGGIGPSKPDTRTQAGAMPVLSPSHRDSPAWGRGLRRPQRGEGAARPRAPPALTQPPSYGKSPHQRHAKHFISGLVASPSTPVFANCFLFLNKWPPLAGPGFFWKPGGCVRWPGAGRETPPACLFFVKQLVSVRSLSPSRRRPLAVSGTKGRVPGGRSEEGKKKRKREKRSPPPPVTPPGLKSIREDVCPATCHGRLTGVGSPLWLPLL